MTGTKHQGQHKEHLHHHSQREIFTDPVCGMSTEEPNAFLPSTLEGETYFFCSEHCLETFKKSPEKFLAVKLEPFVQAEKPEPITSKKFSAYL